MTEKSVANFYIKRALISDAAGIHSAHMRSIQLVCGPDYSREQIGAWGGRPFDQKARTDSILRNYVWVVEKGGQIFGFVELRIDPQKTDSEIMALCLAPEARGFGLGQELLRLTEEKCMRLGVEELTLGSTRTALPFYKAHGFVPAGS